MAKIQKRDVRNLARGINAAGMLQGQKFDQHFTYALSRNKRKIRDMVESINESEKAKLLKYNEAIDKLNEKYGKKSEADNIVMNNTGVVVDPEHYYNYNKELNALEKKHKEDIDENDKFLKEEESLELYMLLNKYFPDLDAGIADFLYPIRKDIDVEEQEEADRIEKEKEKEDKKLKKKE